MSSRVFRRAGAAASLLALFTMLGVHWSVLQSIAWARMLVGYSRLESFRQAVEMTFDGKHPCPLCLEIWNGRQQQEREQQQSPKLKTERTADLFFEPRLAAAPFAPTAASAAVPFVPHWRADFSDSPPKPPPRAASAA